MFNKDFTLLHSQKYIFWLFFLLLFSVSGQAQEDEDISHPMRVVHCTAVSKSTNIQNLHVNDRDQKWIGTTDGVYEIHSADNGTKMSIGPKEWAPLLVNSGNHPTTVDSFGIMDTALVEGKIHIREDNFITAAYYDSGDGSLWVGTSTDGLYRFGAGKRPPLVEHFHRKNSKLRDNYINCIFIDQYDRYWVGTKQGVFFSEEGEKWKLYEKYSSILAITELGSDIWIMGEDVLWRADERNRWIPGDFDLSLAQGEIKDVCFDDDGHLWIASEIITRYHIVNDKVDKFGRAEGFTSKKVTRIKADSDNALWVGTADKGLFLIEKMSKMTVSVQVTQPVTCTGGQKDAALQVKVIGGGRPPYTYNWEQGLKGDSPKDLSPGLYTVTVIDSEDRKKVVSAKVEPPAIRLMLEKTQPATGESAADGQAIAKVSGEVGAARVAWSTGKNGITAQQLAPGTYQATVTDAAGCTATNSVEIDFISEPEPEIEQVDALVVKLDQNGENVCQGQQNVELVASVQGGKTPYQYAWSIAGHTASQKSNLAAGKYSITITDALGTTASARALITEPAAITGKPIAETQASDKRSKDGQASITANGGDQQYIYKWDNGETTATATKLSAGTHRVTITDGNNCKLVASVEIEAAPEKIPTLVVELDQKDEPKCAGDATASIAAKVSGGKPPYTYKWSNAVRNSNMVQQLSAGNYEVTVIDAVGNTKIAATRIYDGSKLLASALAKRGATDKATRDGSAIVAGKGGQAPYIFAWDNGETSARAEKLSPGKHRVTVIDANNCQTSTEVIIKEREIPQLDARTLAAGQTIRLEKLYFEADSAVITTVSEPTLEEVYSFLAENPNIIVEIGGHTNNIPPHEYCDRLSSARAKAVADYVINKGIRKERVNYKGYGKRKPIATNKTRDGRRRNQRVEVKILAIQ